MSSGRASSRDAGGRRGLHRTLVAPRHAARPAIAALTVSLIASWVAFPLLLAAIGLGWGVLVERAAGMLGRRHARDPDRVRGSALVVAGMLTSFAASASAATPIVAVGAGAGLIVLVWPRLLPGDDPPRTESERASAAGACPAAGPHSRRSAHCSSTARPCCSPGEATFTGYVKLDDTATWFNVDRHRDAPLELADGDGRSLPSTVDLHASVHGRRRRTLPARRVHAAGRRHEPHGIDVAWIIQPYFACCAAALALGIYRS